MLLSLSARGADTRLFTAWEVTSRRLSGSPRKVLLPPSCYHYYVQRYMLHISTSDDDRGHDDDDDDPLPNQSKQADPLAGEMPLPPRPSYSAHVPSLLQWRVESRRILYLDEAYQ